MPDPSARDRGAPASPIATLQDLRERIARTLLREGAWCGDCEFGGWDSCSECRRTVREYADAVIAALWLERVECRFCGMDDDGPCDDGKDHAYLWLIGAES